MGSIHVLSEVVANKIAAGEVIERPASIVKELIENALDAGATRIDLEIQNGGKSLIRVSDDGCGMDPEDVKLAFQRYATSKILSAEDLSGVASFGFRGEALPSIAAVSRTRLISRPKGSSSGTEKVVEGGRVLGIQEHPCSIGTIVEVRDLFFNTPARRKFLKSDSTEMGHLLDGICRLSLSAPGVQLSLKAGGKMVLDLPPTNQLQTRFGTILKVESSQELLRLERQREGIRLSGVIGKPTLNRGSRREIHLFINRRWVRALPLSYAVRDGYHGLLMEGRYPVAALFVDLDLARVDVNVHPTKQEVRISREAEVRDFIQKSIRESLSETGDLAPRLLKEGRALPLGRGESRLAAPPFQKNYSLKSAPQNPEAWRELLESKPKISIQTVESAAQHLEKNQDLAIRIRGDLAITRVLGQLQRTFILAETEDGFVVVDQHAAHERVIFEGLLKNFQTGKAERQMLFLEEVLELHPRQEELFKEALPILTKVGFEMELFGERAYVIRSIPAVFGPADPLELIRTFLDQLEEGKGRTVLEEAPEAVAALCACKRRSIKAQDPLTPEAMRALLVSLARCENPFTCPHGRPVFLKQSFSDLERHFKRV